MRHYVEIDWDQERPDRSGLDEAWAQTSVTAITPNDASLEELTHQLASSHDNGGAKAAQFHLQADPLLRWYLTRNRLNEAGFFGRFFRHKEVATPLACAPQAEQEDDLGFQLAAPYPGAGAVAQILSSGGAYTTVALPDAQVLPLMSRFMATVCQQRYSETRVYVSGQAWSPWFKGIAWDSTYFFLDMRRCIATVLMVTDED